MMRFLLSMAVGGLTVAAASSTFAEGANPKATSTVESRMVGAFTFSGGQSERAARKQAIERSVDSMFFAIRGIARSKLEDKTKIAPAVSFRVENNTIYCSVPGVPDAASPADGSPVDYAVAGETVKLSQRIDASRLVQTFASADGTRTNIYVPSADGERFAMRATVQSPKLSVPVAYTLTYSRKH